MGQCTSAEAKDSEHLPILHTQVVTGAPAPFTEAASAPCKPAEVRFIAKYFLGNSKLWFFCGGWNVLLSTLTASMPLKPLGMLWSRSFFNALPVVARRVQLVGELTVVVLAGTCGRPSAGACRASSQC